MKKILAFAGSNHSKSIHHELIEFTSTLINDVEIQVLDIRSWDIPIYSIDMDNDPVQTPELISKLIQLIGEHDGFIIASPEHNGGTPAFLKNILDWLSRRSKKVFNNKPLFLMSTSPGAKGGANHLNFLIHTLPYQGAEVAAHFSLPSFYDHLKDGIMTEEHLEKLQKNIEEFTNKLKE